VFLGGCNLKCCFCQNYDISHRAEGEALAPADIARLMLNLQARGCHNVNFVTPTHVAPQLMEAIALARTRGLTVPVVYNCGGYESVAALELLEGFVDVYMPDAKFWDPAASEAYVSARDYPEIMRRALKEMHRQVGDLVVEEVAVRGRTIPLATRGLVIRHLVMPEGQAGSREIIDFIADGLSPRSYVNIMAQYRPCFRAFEYPEINRPPTRAEFREAHAYAVKRGLRLAR
jgi:putative pyruvate formate lyase activating enzyme